MNPLTGALLLLGALAAIAACWAWLFLDFHRFHREHAHSSPEPLEDLDFTEALRCFGAHPLPEPADLTPGLDRFCAERKR